MVTDAFLKNVNSYLKQNDSERRKLVDKILSDGENPCLTCSKRENCNEMACAPYYYYFKFRWRRMRKMFGMEVEEIG